MSLGPTKRSFVDVVGLPRRHLKGNPFRRSRWPSRLALHWRRSWWKSSLLLSSKIPACFALLFLLLGVLQYHLHLEVDLEDRLHLDRPEENNNYSTFYVAAQLQQPPGGLDPQVCQHVGRCRFANEILPALQQADEQLFREQKPESVQAALSSLLQIADGYFKEPGDALDCRAGGAVVFYRLAEIYRHSVGAPQRAHNLYQLAMSMFWDMSREPGGLECLEGGQVWGLDFNAFMDAYLTLARDVHRHLPEGLPPAHVYKGEQGSSSSKKRKIAITSVCAYKEEHMFYELYALVKQNRDRYAALHGYDSHLWNSTFDANRAPVWSAVGLPLSLVQPEYSGTHYDWVVAADCDMMFINMDVKIEKILDEYVNEETDPAAKDVHVLITEDGRGLAGGIFLIRNSPEGRAIIQSVYGERNTVYDRHDLKDQWSFLWHFIRPKATGLRPQEIARLLASRSGSLRVHGPCWSIGIM
ncbi:unnamed protein product [Amoebophrya sp. A25]|nr:unnamed protein product [Amoebophrya sp. A25]|eukprot:GSA25T00003904001.1